MIFYKNRNISNKTLFIGFIVASIVIITGVLCKIEGYSFGKVILIVGLIIKLQIVLMFIYKFAPLLRLKNKKNLHN